MDARFSYVLQNVGHLKCQKSDGQVNAAIQGQSSTRIGQNPNLFGPLENATMRVPNRYVVRHLRNATSTKRPSKTTTECSTRAHQYAAQSFVSTVVPIHYYTS